MMSLEIIKRNKNCRVNIIVDDTIDEDLQSMLRPLNTMQTVLLNPNYSITDNLIKPNSILFNCLSLCGSLCVISFYLYRLIIYYLDVEARKNMNILYITSLFDFCFYCVGFNFNSINSIIQVKLNIKFVATFQKIHIFLNTKKQFGSFTVGNWICVLCLFSMYLLLACILMVFFLEIPVYNWITGLFLIYFDANIIYAIRRIQMLKDKIHMWNKEIVQRKLTGSLSRKTYCKRMFDAYANILECYNIYKLTSQHMVLCNIIDFISHALLHIQTWIEILKFYISNPNVIISSMAACVLIWLLKTFLLQTTLYLYCEKFYLALRNTQDACAVVLSSNCTDEEQKLCKNIGRLYRASFKEMSACGLFYIDAALPLSLMSLLTNYVIVLLQFAFL